MVLEQPKVETMVVFMQPRTLLLVLMGITVIHVYLFFTLHSTNGCLNIDAKSCLSNLASNYSIAAHTNCVHSCKQEIL